MYIKKYKKTILTMMLGVFFASIISGCGDDVSSGRFVALASTGEVRLIYSDDGINWTPGGLTEETIGSATPKSVCYGNGTFVVVGGGSLVRYSTDGKIWPAGKGEGFSGQYNSVCYGNGKFVAVGGNTGAIFSIDGKTWEPRSLLSDAGGWWDSVCYGNGKFVAIASQVTGPFGKAAHSPDGKTWTVEDLLVGLPSENWKSVCYGKGRFVALSDSGKTIYSTDGKEWYLGTGLTGTWYSVCYGNGKFVTVNGAFGLNIKTVSSKDGKTWGLGEETTITESCSWNSISYGDGKFVAVGYSYYTADNARVAYSTDGINWTVIRVEGATIMQLDSVTYGLDSDIFGFL